MLARVYIELPFLIILPEKTKFTLYDCAMEDYTFRLYPPVKTDISSQLYEEISVDGIPAIQANALRIDFQKKSFDRRKSADWDPPHSLIFNVANLFLARLRYVTRSHLIRPINPLQVSCYLQYLNDDESELEKDPQFLCNRFGKAFSFSWTTINPEIWKDIYTLSPDFIPPHWDTILLNAQAAMPDVGLSMVLAATALEVFISEILNKLAAMSTLPPDIWTWINTRDWLKRPSTEEQFDHLLKAIGGFSLKKSAKLWEAFQNIRTARNSFVHDGEAQVGKQPVSQKFAGELINKTYQIITYIKKKLPEDLQWPEFKHKPRVRIKQKIF